MTRLKLLVTTVLPRFFSVAGLFLSFHVIKRWRSNKDCWHFRRRWKWTMWQKRLVWFSVVMWGFLLVLGFFCITIKLGNIKGITNTRTYPPFLCSWIGFNFNMFLSYVFPVLFFSYFGKLFSAFSDYLCWTWDSGSLMIFLLVFIFLVF